MTLRTDWRPHRCPQPAGVSTNYRLAGAIREINAKLAVLEPVRVAALMPSWHASWRELERQREAARDDPADLDAIQRWREHWNGRLR
jgi:hypothetical protein